MQRPHPPGPHAGWEGKGEAGERAGREREDLCYQSPFNRFD